jgi:hypothetical protein
MTALANKTIQSIGNDYGEYTDRCKITCAEGVQDSSWATTYNAPLEPTGLIPELYHFLITPENLFIIGVMVVVLAIAVFLYYQRDV